MIAFQPDQEGPLKGLVVLDLSRLVAGNMVSLQLADYGAEVIKVEDPKKGDPLRDWRTKGLSVHWKVYGRNKKSLTLSLRSAEGRDLLRRLLPTADVMIENFRPGTLEEMGLGPDVLHGIHPGLVLVRVSGWGQDGPYRERPGFGTLVEGVSGFASKNGFPDRPPVLPPLAMADMIAGLYGAFSVMVALKHRDRTGQGQVIDLPLLDPIVSILGPEAAQFKLTGQIPQRTGSQSRTASPRNAFQSRDGRWIAISASMQSMAERVYAAVGRPDMTQDPRFRTNADRIKIPDEAEAPLRDFIAARDFAEVMAHFERHEVTAAPIYDIDQFLEDPHVQARQIIVELPDAEMGAVPMHNVVPRLSASPGAIRTPAPELGEHSAEILDRIGVDAGRFAEMKAAGIV